MFKVRWAMINLCTKIKKYFGLLPSLSVKKKFNQYLASYKQECGCLVHFAHLANTLSLFWCVHCIDSRQIYALHCNRQLKHKRQEEGPRDALCQLKLCQLPRNRAETTCTRSLEQIEVMKLEGYIGAMCNKHVHSTMTRSSRFHCPIKR